MKQDEDYLKEFIWAIEVAEGQVVLVGMNGSSCTVRFVESHLLDVKTAPVRMLILMTRAPRLLISFPLDY